MKFGFGIAEVSRAKLGTLAIVLLEKGKPWNGSQISTIEPPLPDFTFGDSVTEEDDQGFMFAKEIGLKMVTGSFHVPKRNPSRPLGDDAHFICSKSQSICIADGV
ncbi:hypothetical protein LguiA_019392 [Lonicera macranthoides]